MALRRLPSILKSRSYFTQGINQISQPLERTPSYVAAKEAVSCIKSGKEQKQSHKAIKKRMIPK